MRVLHTLKPVYDKNSRVLILGTMPSPKSREAGFYYGHPQNRFWIVMAKVFGCAVPITNAEKEVFLREHYIAMWDVLNSCDITGASDNSIKNPVVNDFSNILAIADIKTIYTTGIKATEIYKKYCFPRTKLESFYLPSTSPANRKRYSLDELVEIYSVIAD